jgi:Beta/Gamma crystallin
MKSLTIAAAIAALAAMPLLAAQPPQAKGKVAATETRMHTIRGQLTLYEEPNYNGDSFMIDESASRVHTDWNIRSVSVHPGDRWQICARPRFRDCIVLNRSVHDATMIGIQGQIGSARPAPAEAPAPAGN